MWVIMLLFSISCYIEHHHNGIQLYRYQNYALCYGFIYLYNFCHSNIPSFHYSKKTVSPILYAYIISTMWSSIQKIWINRWHRSAPKLLLLKWIIPAWISNHICHNVWDEITYPFPNFNSVAVEVWEWIGNFMSHRICEYLSMLRLKWNHVNKGVLWRHLLKFVPLLTRNRNHWKNTVLLKSVINM